MDPEKDPKRRRIDAAAALSRPFKSPLRRNPPDGSSPDTLPMSEKPTDAGKPDCTKPTAEPSNPNDNGPASSLDYTVAIHLHCGPAAPPGPVSQPSAAPAVDTEMVNLQRQRRELDSRADNLRFEHHAVSQARSIQAKDKSTELQGLIRKWRQAAQKAAEEVFETSRARIDQQGGFQAFKQKTQKTRETLEEERSRHRSRNLEPEQIEELEREEAGNGLGQTKTMEDDSDVGAPKTCLGLKI
ncbi:hypothetical protein N7492_007199 [Penicillium capsulatum]|uniref:Uncharacterized protein n=1 Tax=Penicillium capsulatum TaxID=69766 RepID=A0A9W9LKJ3_9EURO|nr:hypothetical protein N7492_007199 [Penicillium capsulatum]KAJ6117037.1 hypothetical protein N7512_006762 [Penicillium capsulatum]